MSGILFLRTQTLETIKDFYLNEVGAEMWQDQDDCIILRHGNFLFGFCQREETDRECLLTFFFNTREQVDQYYNKFKAIALTEPVENEKYNIYQFFAMDPEGRKLEFQYFNDPVHDYLSGDELLLSRRSIREFLDKEIPEDILDQLVELCRFAPTACNTQGYYFKFITDKKIQRKLSELRGSSSSPIRKSPMAVAIVADPLLTKRAIEDGCIAAYHFCLAARQLGLGTCWIAAMDRDEVKEMLNIPQDHFIATVTPLGFPESLDIQVPERKPAKDFIR